MTQNASFGPLVSFFKNICVFLYLLIIYLISIGIIEVIKLRRGYGYAATRKTGPNNVSHVVWALK